MTAVDGEDDSALREELQSFGFSETEIDTYLALLRHGEGKTSTIAETADVTQRAVYNIAERLEERGLVEVNDHASPTTILALPPDEAMGNLSEQIESITPLLERRYDKPQPETPRVQMLKSRETALKRIESAITGAEQELFLAIPEYIYEEVEAELRSAVDRGVLVFLLLGEMEAVEEIDFAGVADIVHCWDEQVPVIYAVDGRAAMIGSADIVSGTHDDDDAVEISQTRLTGTVLGTYLGTFWPASTEVYVTEPVSLPRTFESFRQAVFHAALHGSAGTSLAAEVETISGEMISGTVTQIRQGLVEPVTNDFSVETSLHVDTGSGVVSVGGPETFIEEYEAETVTLRVDELGVPDGS